MWILIIFVIIGIGTVISYLREQSNQNKKIIELLEEINKNNY
ncbi:hypothetical protein [Anaerobacillus arseniciselenatis]|nr:hypothetical protein [Anaerobacillus arseniciselenatis]